MNITWSLMHPTPLNVEYMKRVIEEAKTHPVDSFEICAECHTLFGGMNGLVFYEEYPKVHATLDTEAIRANREKLREILALAHQAGKPVLYWHREVTVWPAVIREMPGLMDENGEFNLLGEAFENLLRYKIRKSYEAVPELDGMVLTLTEADFSAIHNSRPDLYPPEQVVNHVVRIFAEEHQARGKCFVLRSFGSISEDYEQILQGARLAAKDYSFEVETKITPYDFDPFLPDNPFLRRMKNLTLGAECDCLGEFLGAGMLPSVNVRNIVRFVRYGQSQAVDRYVIRLDRVGNNIFDNYLINLYAYEQAILHPELTAEEIYRSYLAEHYPADCQEEMRALCEEGITFAEKALFVDHNVFFHTFPPREDMKWVRAGGALMLFGKEGVPLSAHTGMWGILFNQRTPGRKLILADKEEAVAIAERNLARVEKLLPSLAKADGEKLLHLWSNACIAARGMRELMRVICAYFEDMEAKEESAPRLRKAVEEMRSRLHVEVSGEQQAFFNGNEHRLEKNAVVDAHEIFEKRLASMTQVLLREFPLEWKVREAGWNLPGAVDVVIPGAITDEIRCVRYMHASHVEVRDGRIGRYVGNTVFPNGFLDVVVKCGPQKRLYLQGKGTCLLEMDGGAPLTVQLEESPVIPLPNAQECKLHFRKSGMDFPWISLIAVAD